MTDKARIAIVALALSCTACSTLSAIRGGGSREDIEMAARVDARTWGGAACANAPAPEQAKLRAVIPVLALAVKNGNTPALRAAMLDQAGSQAPQTLWWAISAAMTAFGSQGDWLASLDTIMGDVVLACDEALGIGTA